MIKKTIFQVLITVLLASSVFASNFHEGDSFPDITLAEKISPQHRSYLGLKGEGPWKLKDIEADYVLIEIYSMYCPHCQKEAKNVNELYSLIKSSDKYSGIKLIGIGAGNSDFEIKFFKEKYGVEFPLLPDEDLSIHKALGSTGTPYFYLVKTKNEKLKTAISHEGPFKEPAKFLERISKAAGIK